MSTSGRVQEKVGSHRSRFTRRGVRPGAYRGLGQLAVLSGLGVGLVLGLCPLWISPAHGLGRGQILLSEKRPPQSVKEARLLRFMGRNKVSVLTRLPGKQSWPVYIVAHLRSNPSRALLSLPHKKRKLFLAFYRRVGKTWVQDNVDDVDFRRAGSRLIRIPYRISKTLGLKIGVQYQLRITLLDGRRREIVLASTSFTLK